MGFTIAELEEMDEGMVMDVVVEAANDRASEEYQELATQEDFDAF